MKRLAVMVIVPLLLSCGSLQSNAPPQLPTDTAQLPQIQVTPETSTKTLIFYKVEGMLEYAKDPVEITSYTLDGDILTLMVRYHGGCQQHSFDLYAPQVFLESNPPQAMLVLGHDAHGDACKAMIEHEIQFDLAPLRQSNYDVIQLRITESDLTQPNEPLPLWRR